MTPDTANDEALARLYQQELQSQQAYYARVDGYQDDSDDSDYGGDRGGGKRQKKRGAAGGKRAAAKQAAAAQQPTQGKADSSTGAAELAMLCWA